MNAVNTAASILLVDVIPRDRKKTRNHFNMNNREAIVLGRCAKCLRQNNS
jgi:hypothetical protein